MNSRHNWCVVLGLVRLMSPGPTAQEDPCRAFQRALEPVPHVVLTHRIGPIESMWNGEPPAMCEVKFETTDSVLAGAVVPDLVARQGSELQAAGWRMIPEILADGAGSGVHGIQRNGVRCVIGWEQPAYIDDDGSFVPSDTFSMVIQCRRIAPA